MQVLTTIVARLLFALPMLIFGIFHFLSAGDMAGMVPIPGGVFWVYLTGLALIAAAIAIIIQKMGKLAAMLLALMLVIFALTIHLPGAMGDGGQTSVQNLLKDLALAGGALGFAYMLEQQEEAEASSAE